jgi:hypothetical protein
MNFLANYLKKQLWSAMLFLCIALGVTGIFFHNAAGHAERFSWEILGNGLMLAGACFFAGGLCGFLFGIPRTVQGEQVREEVDYRINTNLEQISDWLTKIIVGLTLVNLQNIPPFFTKLAIDITPGMGGQAEDTVFAGGIIVYFLILGFLGGYIITRTQISSLFSRADANLLFSRRDTDLLRAIAEIFEAGKAMTEEEIKELQGHIAKASLLTQNSIFAYTKNCRKIFHRRKQTQNIANTIPIFTALVDADYEGLNHQYRGQLGYAYKDQHLDKKRPWDEATEKAMAPDFEKAAEMFELAILIRGDWKSKGYGVYELNLAITRLELLRLRKKYPGLPQLSERETDAQKKLIRDYFAVAWESGESYRDTIRRDYSSWYDAQTQGVKIGDIVED